MSDDTDDKHAGYAIVETCDGWRFVALEPHTCAECDQKVEEAAQLVRGHETVYESRDANSVRASVGYSRSYADNFDKAMGKN